MSLPASLKEILQKMLGLYSACSTLRVVSEAWARPTACPSASPRHMWRRLRAQAYRQEHSWTGHSGCPGIVTASPDPSLGWTLFLPLSCRSMADVTG